MNTYIKFATLTLGVATVVGSANADITVYANDFESSTVFDFGHDDPSYGQRRLF